jgi:N-acetylmuramoyl-L-alanine amidase
MSLSIDLVPSPNHGERRTGPVDILLLHHTGMPTCQGALDWLCTPGSDVSCHYLVFEDGRIVQLVDETRRAWHAGLSFWKGESDINSRSIGIEICNPGDDGSMTPFPRPQIDAVIALSADILARHAIPPERVLAHSDVAPERKSDPAAWFPWDALAAAGIGHWVAPAPIVAGRTFALGDEGQPIRALQALFAVYGYRCPVTGVFDEQTRKVVEAFQRHFRTERIDGVADPSTVTTIYRLIDGLGPKVA